MSDEMRVLVEVPHGCAECHGSGKVAYGLYWCRVCDGTGNDKLAIPVSEFAKILRELDEEKEEES